MCTIFITHPTPDGSNLTITSELGRILRIAEERYGTREQSYTILGVHFTQNKVPNIWYPPSGKHIIIQITMDCMHEMNRAVWQVAHEVIHCLSPVELGEASVLEEGLATLFAIEYTRENGNGFWESDDQRYTEASELVKQLISIDSDIIIKLRKIQPTISLIGKDLIMQTNSNVPEELANNLTKYFK